MGGSSSSQRRRRTARQQQQAARPTYPAGQNVSLTQNRAAGTNQQPYYLMFGGPPVHFRQTPGGPMIFYVDREHPTAPPPEVQNTGTIKNLACLLKPTVALVPVGGSNTKFLISFKCNTTAETDVKIYLAATEVPDPQTPKSGGAMFVTDHVLPVGRLPADTDQTYTSQASDPFDVEKFASQLKYNPQQPATFPVVVALAYTVHPAPAEEGSSDTPPPSKPEIRQQYTYCEVLKSEEDGEVKHTLRAMKQRLQADGALFELEEIYGVAAEGHDEGDAVEATVAEVGVDGDECVICMENERDTTVMPCRHMCLCGECAEVLRRQTNKCPICRTVIERLMTRNRGGPAAPPS